MRISLKDLNKEAFKYGISPLPDFRDKPKIDTISTPYYKWIVTAHPEWNKLDRKSTRLNSSHH